MQQIRYQEMIEQLEMSQDMVEKSAFETLNQQDTVSTMISQLTLELDHMMTKMEAMNYSLEDTMETICHKIGEEEMRGIREFSSQLEQQGVALIEISQLMQRIMEEETKESEIIHELESQTEKQRDIVTTMKQEVNSGSDL